GIVTAPDGGGTITFTNGALVPSSSCSFSVSVTGTTVGVKNNTTGAVTSTEGGTGGTAGASLTVDTPPTASLSASNVTTAGGTIYTFTVTYSDNVAINVASLDSNDVRVTGPGGFNQLATFVSVDNASNGTPRTATYIITPPGGSWDVADNGAYTVVMEANQVFDTTGNPVAAGPLGTVQVTICGGITCPANITVSNNPNQCGAVVNYPAPTTNGACVLITCSPASGSFFPKGTTTVTCTSSAGPSCPFTVTVNDTQPPSITCPADIAVGTAGSSA